MPSGRRRRRSLGGQQRRPAVYHRLAGRNARSHQRRPDGHANATAIQLSINSPASIAGSIQTRPRWIGRRSALASPAMSRYGSNGSSQPGVRCASRRVAGRQGRAHRPRRLQHQPEAKNVTNAGAIGMLLGLVAPAMRSLSPIGGDCNNDCVPTLVITQAYANLTQGQPGGAGQRHRVQRQLLPLSAAWSSSSRGRAYSSLRSS